jgi:uncharacterized FlaG/YvyC family protein
MEIGPISFQDFAPRQVRQAARTEATGFAAKLQQAQRTTAPRTDAIPASPPPDVIVEVGQAAARVEELAKANRQLHFEKDPTSGRIIVQVQDLDGNVLRTIPPSSALDVMSGAGL